MSESQSPASWGFPKDVVEKLQETALRVTQGVPAFRSSKAILTEEEWRQVKGELASFFPDVFGEPSKEPAKRPPSYAIRKLMELRKISEPRAILELGRRSNSLCQPPTSGFCGRLEKGRAIGSPGNPSCRSGTARNAPCDWRAL